MQVTPTKTVSVMQACGSEYLSDLVSPALVNNAGAGKKDGPNELSICNELELFLLGLDLKELIPRFLSHKVTFQAFLQMTDSDLCQLGISQSNVRQCILNAIDDTHKKRLKHCSSKPVQYYKRINCSESIAMLTNIKRHLGFMGSSIGYVSDRMNEDKQIVLDSPDPVHIYELCSHTDDALVNLRNLYQELAAFRMQLQELYPVKDFIAENLINVSRAASFNWKRAVLLCGGAFGCLGTICLFVRG